MIIFCLFAENSLIVEAWENIDIHTTDIAISCHKDVKME
jgi:hypothetical protein